MVYVAGILGFFGGFAFGQLALYFLLRDRSREEILTNKHLHRTYGVFNWIAAILGAWSFVIMYNHYFAGP